MRQKLRIGPQTGAPSIFLLMALALVYCVGLMGEGAAQRSLAAKAPGRRAAGLLRNGRAAGSRARDARGHSERGELWAHRGFAPRLRPQRAQARSRRRARRRSRGLLEGNLCRWARPEILAALGQILEAGYVILPTGRDLENNRIYVWPYFAEVELATTTPAQEVELMRLLGAATARELKAKGRYSSWRIAIGADGVWHSFRKMP